MINPIIVPDKNIPLVNDTNHDCNHDNYNIPETSKVGQIKSTILIFTNKKQIQLYSNEIKQN